MVVSNFNIQVVSLVTDCGLILKYDASLNVVFVSTNLAKAGCFCPYFENIWCDLTIHKLEGRVGQANKRILNRSTSKAVFGQRE